ncbi:MAG TPA: DUF5362 family protein [Chitinophagaceae bacterium]
MENDQLQGNNLFNLTVDNPVKSHLGETAKWGRFLAIVGFIMLGLMIVFGLVMIASPNLTSSSDYNTYGDATPMAIERSVTAILLILFCCLYFFPCLFLLRYSNKMKTALLSDDQQGLTESFRNLKLLFRFIGILTLIVLAVYALIFIIIIVTAATIS